MDNFVAWVVENMEWLFSGIGLAVAVGLLRLLFKKSSNSISQSTRSGDGSTNILAGRDVRIERKKTDDNVKENGDDVNVE